MKRVFSRIEILAGITTFMTLSYIVVVNPMILSTPGTGMTFNQVLTATVFSAFISTLLMGLFANLPFALAPGMGINVFFTYTLVINGKIPWQSALGIVFWAGVILVAVSLSPLRSKIVEVLPMNLRMAIAGGIGIFLTFIGLRTGGWIRGDAQTLVHVALPNPPFYLSLVGLIVTVGMLKRKSPLAYLTGIAAVTGLAWLLGYVHVPDQWMAPPDFSGFFKLDPGSALQLQYFPALIALFFTDFFDSVSTFVGVSQASGLVDARGQPKNLKQALVVDSVATLVSGLVGTSSATTYVESSSGVQMGGRTGATAIVCALCFIPCFFVAPLAAMVPVYATAPVLMLIGFSMFRSISGLDLESIEEALPVFVTVVLIPLSFSITQGIFWGMISHCGLYLLVGRGKEVSPLLYILSAIALILLLTNTFG